jgi:polysaccharide deacetylase family protein (PEP-CTERM system associated)
MSSMNEARNRCVFSIDVEDWFHILGVPSTPRLAEWDDLPSHVERNFIRLLDLAAEHDVRCTCFFLGWVGKRFPQLVKTAVERGHEIASHGWAHRLAYELSPGEFYEDAVRSKSVLEEISGRAILGYRSAGFSLTEENSWVFDQLLRAGYVYDSSVFPARRSHGGWQNGEFYPYVVNRTGGSLLEFPMTTEKVLGRPICFFGGGYLRFFPLSVIQSMTEGVLQQGRPVIFYVHPREIDPTHPRLKMGRMRRFKSYVNLESTEVKLHQLLETFEFVTLGTLAAEMTVNAMPLIPAQAAIGL